MDFMEELLWDPTCDAPREAATSEAETKSPFLPWCPSWIYAVPGQPASCLSLAFLAACFFLSGARVGCPKNESTVVYLILWQFRKIVISNPAFNFEGIPVYLYTVYVHLFSNTSVERPANWDKNIGLVDVWLSPIPKLVQIGRKLKKCIQQSNVLLLHP